MGYRSANSIIILHSQLISKLAPSPLALINCNALNDNWIRQVSSNEETIDNLDKQLADSKITLSDSENKFDDISRKLVRSLSTFWHYYEAVHLLTLTVSVDLAMILRDIILLEGLLRGEEEVSLLSPDRKQMWKFWPIFSIEIWFFDTQNTFYLIVRGSKNACP